MKTFSSANIVISQAIESKMMDRDMPKKIKISGGTDRYKVKIRDDKGREYEIIYQ